MKEYREGDRVIKISRIPMPGEPRIDSVGIFERYNSVDSNYCYIIYGNGEFHEITSNIKPYRSSTQKKYR